MIDYIRDLDAPGKPIGKFPHTLEGMIAIFSRNGKYMRCPAWGVGKTIVKVDKDHVYVQSDTAGKVDLFNSEGIKVMEIDEEK